MKLFTALGLDLKIFIAQLINFSVLIFVLWRFAYKPVFEILETRRLKIAKGLTDSDEAGKRLTQAEEERQVIVAGARKEANEIIEESKKRAELRYQEIVDKAKADLKLVIADEKEKIKAERNYAIKEIKKDAAQMISAALLKILPEKVNEKSDDEMIKSALRELE